MKRRAMLWYWLTACTLAAATVPEMDSARGERVFASQGCVDCHRLRGRGGTTGPDLSQSVGRARSPEELTASMRNHAPVMWATIRGRGGAPQDLNPQAAADLFAAFYSTRYFETPGDAARGKRLFHDKSCDQCHGLTNSPNPKAAPVSQWRELTDPVALVGAMWLHSPQMRSELAAQKKSWPELSGQDLADLQVYLRHSAPGGQSEAGAFQISAPAGGEQLFAAKGCAKCHGEQGRKISRSTLTGTAAAMWNHARILRYQAPQVNPQEMRGLVSYTWARPYFEPTGSVQRGRQVFTAKKCSTCHEGGGGPDLHARAGDFNGISMISSLWRHGPSMLGRMTEQKMPWPIFRPGEMSDLLAFLNTPSRTAGGAR